MNRKKKTNTSKTNIIKSAERIKENTEENSDTENDQRKNYTEEEMFERHPEYEMFMKNRQEQDAQNQDAISQKSLGDQHEEIPEKNENKENKDSFNNLEEITTEKSSEGNLKVIIK